MSDGPDERLDELSSQLQRLADSVLALGQLVENHQRRLDELQQLLFGFEDRLVAAEEVLARFRQIVAEDDDRLELLEREAAHQCDMRRAEHPPEGELP